MTQKKPYSIGYTDRRGKFMKVWENGRTKKYTLAEAREEALKIRAYHDNVRIYKGWEIVE